MEKQITQFKKIALGILSFLGFASFAAAQCGAGEVEVYIDVTTDNWGYECYWELVPTGNSCGVGAVASGGNTSVGCFGGGLQSITSGGYGNSGTFTEGPYCLTVGTSYDLITVDDWGDGGSIFEIYMGGALINTFTATGAGSVHTFTAIAPPSSNLSLAQVYYDTIGTMVDSSSTSYYTQIPVRQSAQDLIFFAGDIQNNGTSAQTNALLSTSVTHNSNTVYAESSPAIGSIASGATSSAIINTPFSATATGTYNVSFAVSSDSTDQNPIDNSASGSFEVTDTVYARDDGNYTGWGGWIGSGEIFSMANWFEVFTDDTASSISIYMQGNTTDPAVVKVHLYDIDLNPIASSGFITLDASGIGTWVTISIPETPMPAGGYAAGVETFSTEALVAINPDAAPMQTSFVYVPADGQWYWLGYVPFIRLNTKAPSISCDLSTSSGTSSDVSCPGYADGYAVTTGGGGTAPYAYLWNDAGGSTTDSIGGLSGGSYTVAITDANSCVYSLAFTVNEPGALALTSAMVDVTCNGGADGSATVNVAGGTAPFVYNWSTAATTATISGLTAGTYTVTVTDANSCPSANLSVTVSEPAAMGLTFGETTATCGAGGTATVTVTGGSAPYMYAWDDPGMQTTATATGLGSGLFTATVTDNNGCVATIADSVSGTDPVTFTSSTTSPSSCGVSDGTATVTVTTGTSPFAYSWSDGQATSTATGLAAASYTVTVTDFVGCTHTETVNVVDVGAPALSITGSNQVSCMGGSDGDATVTAFSPGTPPYNYNWSNGQTTQQATGLAAGSYTVTVTGSDGCSALISTTITEPSTAVTIDSLSVTDVSCNGAGDGAASVYASGGTGSITYGWSNGQTSQNTSGLSGGAYAITVTDANGCTASDSIEVNEAGALSTSTATVNISCNGANDGSIDLTIAGGTAPFTYSWTPGGNTTEDVTGLSQGTYSVLVTDANGCTGNDGSSITEPQILSVSTGTVTDPTSIGGTDGAVDMTVTGGTAPYTYLWNTGESTEDLTNVGAGSYTLAVTDANGCAGTAVAVVADGPDGVAENLTNLGFAVYPNPNDGKFTVTLSKLPENGCSLMVRNIIGQLVYSEELAPSAISMTKYIDLSEKERGVYFISLVKEDGMRTEKLIVY